MAKLKVTFYNLNVSKPKYNIILAPDPAGPPRSKLWKHIAADTKVSTIINVEDTFDGAEIYWQANSGEDHGTYFGIGSEHARDRPTALNIYTQEKEFGGVVYETIGLQFKY